MTGHAHPRVRSYDRASVVTRIRDLHSQGKIALSPHKATRNAAGDCLAPVQVTERGVDLHTHASRRRNGAVWYDAFYRCRQCAPCLRYRSREWAARAIRETECSKRTWLVTLTLRPEAHWRLRLHTEARLRRRSVRQDALTDREIWMEQMREVGREATLWLKRIRERAGAFRYLLVVEPHKSGLPHFHVLVHETEASITYRDLTLHWVLGFSNAKLVSDPRGAAYVAKYVGKSMSARVRASSGYGKPTPLGLGPV